MPSFSWLKIKNSGQEADSALIESLEETPVSQWSSKQLTQFLRDNKKKIELEKKDIKSKCVCDDCILSMTMNI